MRTPFIPGWIHTVSFESRSASSVYYSADKEKCVVHTLKSVSIALCSTYIFSTSMHWMGMCKNTCFTDILQKERCRRIMLGEFNNCQDGGVIDFQAVNVWIPRLLSELSFRFFLLHITILLTVNHSFFLTVHLLSSFLRPWRPMSHGPDQIACRR